MKVLMMLHNDFEDSEVRQPLDALRQAGIEVDIAAPEAGKIYRGKKGKETVTSTVAVCDTHADGYAMLILPGGYAPDHLRITPGAVSLVRAFGDKQLPIAAVCHGPQLLISAGLLPGRQITCYESIVTDVLNAGAHYVDKPLVVDGNLITSRKPDDLPQFCQAIVATLKGQPVAGLS